MATELKGLAVLIFLGAFVVEAFAAPVKGDRSTVEDYQSRAQTKERAMIILTEMKSHMATEVQKRAGFEKTRLGADIQGESIHRLPLELRLEQDSSPVQLKKLEMYVDGIFWGIRTFSQSELSPEPIYWHQLSLRDIPVGERSLKLVAHVKTNPQLSLTHSNFVKTKVIEGTKSFFVSSSAKKMSLNVEFVFPGFNQSPFLRIESLGEDIP